MNFLWAIIKLSTGCMNKNLLNVCVGTFTELCFLLLYAKKRAHNR